MVISWRVLLATLLETKARMYFSLLCGGSSRHTASHGAAAGGEQQIQHFHTQKFQYRLSVPITKVFLVGAAAHALIMLMQHAHPTPSPRQPATMCHLALRNQPQPPLKLLKTAKHTRLHAAAALPLR
jgi:hypothetical protein